MKAMTIIDTGPLVAFINRRDNFHEWVKQKLRDIKAPLATCESVISEACFLLRNVKGGEQAIFELLSRKLVNISFSLGEEIKPVDSLMRRYANVPMSLADACLVRMTELHSSSHLLTLDSDFTVYRRNNRLVIPMIAPF